MIRRVNTSIRPIELLGLAIAETRLRSARHSSSGTMYTQPFSSTAPAIEREVVHGERVDLVLDGRRRAGQEARAHAIHPAAKPQVQAGGLELVRLDRLCGPDLAAVLDQGPEILGRQQAGGMLRLELARLRAFEQQSI